MVVSESQRLGTLAILVISLAVYGVSYFYARQPVRQAPLPWGNQEEKWTAVVIVGDPERDGIYFLPEGLTIQKMVNLVGVSIVNHDGKTSQAGISPGSTLSLSPKEGVNIREMAAAKKLALGLPVDLNRISEEELSLVPGIGEKTAYQIIQLRKEMGGFRDLRDLMALPGIKEKKLSSLKVYLSVRP
jgi:competence protein ComEA